MKLFAHLGPDGRVEGMVAAPEGNVGAGLTAGPAMTVCEIQDHGFKDMDLDQLNHLLETATVTFTPAQGRLQRK